MREYTYWRSLGDLQLHMDGENRHVILEAT